MKTKLTTYVIYRKGSNKANQPCEFGWVPVYSVEAASRDEAEKAALEAGVTCYANQVLDARPASRCSQSDCTAAWESSREIDQMVQTWDDEAAHYASENARLDELQATMA